MPITIDATPGSAAANSYLTVSEADTYFAERLNSDTWNDATADEKAQALIMATRLMDAKFAWTGAAVDIIQVLGWPRIGMLTRTGFDIATTVIPSELKWATAELALWLLRRDRTNDLGLAGEQAIKRLKAGPMEIEYADAETTQLFNALQIPDWISLMLVPSWWIVVVEEPAIFEAM